MFRLSTSFCARQPFSQRIQWRCPRFLARAYTIASRAPRDKDRAMIPTLGVQSSLPKQPNNCITLTVPGRAWLPDPFQGSCRSDQRAALPARPCRPSGWSGACSAVPIRVIARARQRPKQSPASAGSAPQRPLLLRSPSGSGAGVRARRSWPRRRHPGPPTVRRAIGAAPATALRSAPAASCALRQR